MSVHYLLDGYNILHQMPLFDTFSLEDKREAMLQWIERARPQGSLKNKVTVVFDGKFGIVGRTPSSFVEVVFSQDESADEKIKSILARIQNRKNTVVVTNDRAIQYAVRALGAKFLSVKEFLSHAKESPAKKSSSTQGQTEARKVTDVTAYQITAELKEIWLKRGKGG